MNSCIHIDQQQSTDLMEEDNNFTPFARKSIFMPLAHALHNKHIRYTVENTLNDVARCKSRYFI